MYQKRKLNFIEISSSAYNCEKRLLYNSAIYSAQHPPLNCFHLSNGKYTNESHDEKKKKKKKKNKNEDLNNSSGIILHI